MKADIGSPLHIHELRLQNGICAHIPNNVRQASAIGLFGACTAVSALSVIFDFSWGVGWLFLSIALLFEFALTVADLLRKRYSIDSSLFCLGILVFTVFDPIFFLASGKGFPGVDEAIYQGNEVANLTGLVIALFCFCFYFGRFFVRYEKVKLSYKVGDYGQLHVVRTHILLLSLTISLLAYLMNGEGLSVGNLLATLSARANGYVAFASSALGSENPIISLLAQSIPVAVILWLLSVKDRRWTWKLLTAVVAVSLFAIYAALGGRSGVVIVFTTVGLYLLISKKGRVKIHQIALFLVLAIAVLSFQINYRDVGQVKEGFMERSPFTGFALNREVAFIVENYGNRRDFIRGNNLLFRTLLPVPENFILFISNPVPRKIWPNKPIEPSFGPYNLLRTGFTGFGTESNITPTIPGRFYMNYGLVGVAQAGLIFGIAWGFANRLIILSLVGNAAELLVGTLFSAILFTSLRDLAPGKFYPLLFLLIYIYLSKFKFLRTIKQ